MLSKKTREKMRKLTKKVKRDYERYRQSSGLLYKMVRPHVMRAYRREDPKLINELLTLTEAPGAGGYIGREGLYHAHYEVSQIQKIKTRK